eukprot:scaffold40141_cov39-Prasinocladus_malaysianus.AAC.1
MNTPPKIASLSTQRASLSNDTKELLGTAHGWADYSKYMRLTQPYHTCDRFEAKTAAIVDARTKYEVAKLDD